MVDRRERLQIRSESFISARSLCKKEEIKQFCSLQFVSVELKARSGFIPEAGSDLNKSSLCSNYPEYTQTAHCSFWPQAERTHTHTQALINTQTAP